MTGKSGNDSRGKVLRARVNEEEWNEAHALARELRVSVGVLIRQLLRAAALEHRPRRPGGVHAASEGAEEERSDQ